jgi:hypothetical protein
MNDHRECDKCHKLFAYKFDKHYENCIIYACAPCNYSTNEKQIFDNHRKSKRHLNTESTGKPRTPKQAVVITRKCPTCQLNVNIKSYNPHINWHKTKESGIFFKCNFPECVFTNRSYRYYKKHCTTKNHPIDKAYKKYEGIKYQ